MCRRHKTGDTCDVRIQLYSDCTNSTLPSIVLESIWVKGTVSLISSEPPCKAMQSKAKQCPIHNGTLETFIWLLMRKILSLFTCTLLHVFMQWFNLTEILINSNLWMLLNKKLDRLYFKILPLQSQIFMYPHRNYPGTFPLYCN